MPTKRDLSAAGRHVNLKIAAEAGEALDRTAKRSGSTYNECVRRAILMHEYLERCASEGDRVWVSNSDGARMREIVILT